jgi:predicted permease
MTLLHDFRDAGRLLWRFRGTFACVIVSLGAGIGGSIAIFSLVVPLLLPEVPFQDPERLLDVRRTVDTSVSPLLLSPEFAQLRRDSRSCAPLAAYRGRSVLYQSGDGAERLDAAEVSAGFFEALGLTTVAGRAFTTADERTQAAVVMVSERFWRRRLATDEYPVGTLLSLDTIPMRVVGVVRDAYPVLPRSTDVWLPLPMTPSGLLVARSEGIQSHRASPLAAICRLAAGVPSTQAATELEALNRGARVHRGRRMVFHLTPVTEAAFRAARSLLLLLEGGVLILLALVATNAASLLVVRSREREQQFRIRSLLGASAAVLARARLVEALALVIPGGVLGWFVARWIVDASKSAVPAHLFEGVPSVSGASAAFAIALVMLVATAAASVPALYTWWRHRHSEGDRMPVEGRAGSVVLRVLLAAEVSLAIVLVVASATLVETFARVSRVPLGFEPAGVVYARVTFAERQLASLPARHAFARAFAEALRGRGNVELAFGTEVPISEEAPAHEEVGIERRAARDVVIAASAIVSNGFFNALGVPVVRGRAFDDDTANGDLPAIVVSLAFARQFLNEAALGSVVDIDGVRWRVVGVVEDVARSTTPGSSPEPRVYRRIDDLERYDRRTPAWRWFNRLYFFVRTNVQPTAMSPILHETVRTTDGGVAIDEVGSLTGRVRSASAPIRYATTLVVSLAMLSLAIATVGVYALLMHFVVQQHKEIGIRLAIGATTRHISLYLARQGAVAVAAGTLGGAGASWAVPRLLRAALPDVSVAPAGMVLTALAIITVMAVVGASIPLARACAIDPVRSLKAE